jgi:hypothetical protein
VSAPLVLHWLRSVLETSELSVGATALAALLATYANADGTSCRPGDDRLSGRLDVTARMLRNYRRELRDSGLLAQVRRQSPGRAAEWRLILPASDTGNRLPLDTGNRLPLSRQHRKWDDHNTGNGTTTTPETGFPPPPHDLPQDLTGVAVGLSSSRGSTVSLSPRAQLVASRLPAATPTEKENIVQQLELMKPNNFRAYFRSIPQDDLDAIRKPVASNGHPGGPQSNACRIGEHSDCAYHWCTCPHHLAGMS